MESYKLSNGVSIPCIGFGVCNAKEGLEAKNAVLCALQNGYMHIDTAMIYNNEFSVGQAIKESHLNREDIFLTTKLWNEDINKGLNREGFERSINLLNVAYVDLYLLHWPTEGYIEPWKCLEQLYLEGKIKAIGVSNFRKHHLEALAKHASIIPMVNQIESNVYFNNQELIDYCLQQGIVVQAWSPLGGHNTAQLKNDVLVDIASQLNKSVAQIVIRWHLQRGVLPLPKSVTKQRIIDNIDVFDFSLSKDMMDAINALNKNKPVGLYDKDYIF